MTRQKVDVIPASVRSVQNGGQLKSQTNIRVAAYCLHDTESILQRPHHPEARLDLCRHLRG